MINLAAAAAFLLAVHVVPSSPLRPWAIGRLGKLVYMGLFSVISAGALVWLIMAFRAAPAAYPFWITSGPARFFTAIVMMAAFILLVAGLTSPNPSAPGGVSNPGKLEPWRGIYAVTRHPVLWAIGIWGILHLINRPDPVNLLFFGTLTLLALGGAGLQERRKRVELGKVWQEFEAHTSFVPFVAILQKRAVFSLRDIAYWRIAAGIALWAVVLGVHSDVFGVSAV
ncbi:MAG: NnrU family protein [Methyloligellaceae bacterium]